MRSRVRGVVPLVELDRKALGAFYTDTPIADFLVWWSVRSGRETVLDPCFGGGVFLKSACNRLLTLSGDPRTQVFGVEIDPQVHGRVAEELKSEFGVRRENLTLSDFFDVSADQVSPVDVIVGNPPFIRYHRFAGTVRRKALERAASESVDLSGLSSSWAPFLVHSVTLLRAGGRLAMVVPAEIGHAAYALPVLNYLSRRFRTVTILTFRKRLFSDLNENTFLILCEGKDEPGTELRWRDFESVGQLSQIARQSPCPGLPAVILQSEELMSGRAKLIEQFIPMTSRHLYRDLLASESTRLLGDVAGVGIGYVTGANDYFHLDDETVKEYGIPQRFLMPSVRRSRDLLGTTYSREDWLSAKSLGQRVYLLSIKPDDRLPHSVLRYIKLGEGKAIHQAYKCRNRSPWYSVPQVVSPDAFLAYMSGHFPRLVSNDAGAAAPNSLLLVRLKPSTRITARSLAALWQTSLTHLSAEIEGHSLGGGMLKLEPMEARQVIIPYLENQDDANEALAAEIDKLIRQGDALGALELADREILMERIGLSLIEVTHLRKAVEILRERRCARG